MQSSRNFKSITILALAIGGGLFAVSEAHGGPLAASQTIGGWTLNTSDGVTVSGTVSGDTLHLMATVDSLSLAGGVITFVQSSPSATPLIDIDTYTLDNNSGSNFGEYQGFLLNPYSGPPGSQGAIFASASDVFTNIAPFTTLAYDPNVITLSDGILNNGASATFSGGGGLLIDANPVSDGAKAFSFKGIGTPAAVPLPAAAGLGAAGIGAVVAGQSRRKRKSKRA